ncbi:MAG: hypothetical protein KAU14_02485 [Thermoplasmata archaeon]|nr:hypothetical protein [Thermoplasmata archaeon]
MSIEEASEFWDSHSVADFPTHVVRIEYTPKEHTFFVAIAQDLLIQLAEKAKERGVSVETLVNLWIQEKVAT